MNNMNIKKRDGRIEAFDTSKIVRGINACYCSLGQEVPDGVIDFVISEVETIKKEEIDIDKLQNCIIKALKKQNKKAAKEYYTYYLKRKEARDRQMNGDYYNTILEIVNGETNDTTNENANKDAKQLFTMRDLIAGETCKKLYKEYVMSPRLKEYHEKHIVHVHDNDYRLMKGITNCFSRDTKFITSNGVKSFNDFQDGDEVYVPTHTGEWKKSIVHCYGKQNVFEYSISQVNRPNYGVKVKATENHRWFLSSGVETTNLKPNDELLTKNDLIHAFDWSRLNDEDLKYWAYGFIIGDGNTVETKYMYSHGLGKRLKSSNAHRLWITRVRLCDNKNQYRYIFDKLGWRGRLISNTNDIEYYTYDFNKNEFLNKEQWLGLSVRQIVCLVNGLLSADGHKSHGKYRGISSSNPKIIKLIENLFPVAGYYITNLDINDKPTNYGKRNYPLHTYHFTLQLPRKTKNGLSHVLNYKVINKTQIGEEEVWCLDVEDNHSFILANGLITGNCCLADLKNVFEHGTVLNGKLIRTPHSLRTAATIATQVIASIGNSQYGGISMSISHLAPFVKVSLEKIKNKLNKWGKYDEGLAENLLKDEVKDAIQTFIYQLNSLSCSSGQAPFITVFLYINENMEYQKETVMLIEEVLKQRIEGMESPTGQNINPAFPKLIYVLDENNIHEDSEFYYLTKLAAKCTSKRMVPDYISAKKMKEYKDGRVFPAMGKAA